jgi:hypothetical protein
MPHLVIGVTILNRRKYVNTMVINQYYCPAAYLSKLASIVMFDILG